MTEAQILAVTVDLMLGSRKAAAQAMNVTVETVRRWINGSRTPDGPFYTAARAIIRHPEEYTDNETTASP